MLSKIIKFIRITWQRHSINFQSFLILFFGLFLNTLMISLTHERVPNQLKPLSDIGFDLLMIRIDNLIIFTEFYITIQNVLFLIFLIFHPKRELIFRRFTFITGFVYMFRSFCFTVTTLPPSILNSCAKKFTTNMTNYQFIYWTVYRMIDFSQTFGFVTQRKINLCGDQIFSGHTLIIVLVHLFINTYYYPSDDNREQKNNVKYIIKAIILKIIETIHFMLTFIAISSLIISHQHYTIDIIISIYICTQLFWTYHSLCMNYEFLNQIKIDHYKIRCNIVNSRMKHWSILRDYILNNNNNNNIYNNRNFIKHFWWWPLFVYFEIENQLHYD